MAQTGGDQIVDGIGETSLLARYPLTADAADVSRNGFTATLAGGSFIEDQRSGKSLSLPGTPDCGLRLPVHLLFGSDSMTFTGWFRPTAESAEAGFFCIGRPGGRTLMARAGGEKGILLVVMDDDQTCTWLETGVPLRPGQWNHVAFVIDGASRALKLFVDGEPAGKPQPVSFALDTMWVAGQPDQNVLLIARGWHGQLRDVRVYSVALTDRQLGGMVRPPDSPANDRPTVPATRPAENAPALVQFGGPRLVKIPDIAVTTPIGRLPQLPAFVDGQYEGGAPGPRVRVIWPSPRTIGTVRRAGTHAVVGRAVGTGLTVSAVVTVSPEEKLHPGPGQVLEPFPLGAVSLDRDANGRPTLFQRNRDKFLNGLLNTRPDDFLYAFRDAFGQPQPPDARPLGVWDALTVRLRGQATGHYLSALAQAYGSCAFDPPLKDRFRAKIDYTVDVLADLAGRSGTAIADPTRIPPGPGRIGFDSDLSPGRIRTDCENWGRGFISAYPPDQFILLEQGATYGTRKDQIWAPYYTLHKILAGLLDCHEITGNPKALDVARGMGLWCFERLRGLPAEQRAAMWNRYIAGEYGGMNEVLVRLARLTGDRRFLDAARLFDNAELFFGGPDGDGGLAANVDTLRGKHANQHIPQAIGALETYAATGQDAYFRVARHFWHMATTSYAYSIGGVAGARQPANAECFTAEPDTLAANGFSEAGQNETCATYNLLKLSRGLFMFEPDSAAYIDYYERAMLNDILASVAEHDAGNTYHIPLNPGARKTFTNAAMNGFTCCNGTALESNTKLQDTIYLQRRDAAGASTLYVNLFVPSTLTWEKRQAVVRQETNFPYSDRTRLTLKGMAGTGVRVRVPGWATQGVFVTVNGQARRLDAVPGRYLDLGNDWQEGDVIDLRMPLAFRFDRLMDRPNLTSLCYGPVVLACEEEAALPDWRTLQLDPARPDDQITGDPATLRFTLGRLRFRPFFESYGRYSVYFDIRPVSDAK